MSKLLTQFFSKAKDNWCLTIRGSWDNMWTECDKKTGKTTYLTHGRKEVNVV